MLVYILYYNKYIYIKIDDIIIQGGFIRNMFEHMHIQKSSIDIDMYLLSEFLIMQKEFIMVDFQLETKNKSCRKSLPAYMNFIDSPYPTCRRLE